MSSSALREFARCPSRWVGGYEPPDSEAKQYGSLLDCLALTPDQFDDRYAVRPATYPDSKTGEPKPWNANSNWCKAWIEEQEGAEIVSPGELDEAQLAVKRLRSDEIIASFLDDSDKQVWVAGLWKDEATGIIVPVKCLIDLVPRADTVFAKCLGDLKTTRNAALMPWQRWCYSAGYHIQAAFNNALYCAATGEDRTDFCFIVQENYPPFQTGKRLLSQDFMALGLAAVSRALADYCQCLKAGKWPGYDDTDEAVQSWSVVAPEPWMASHEQFAPHLNFGETEPGTAAAPSADDLIP
jgi:hypothetical protein